MKMTFAFPEGDKEIEIKGDSVEHWMKGHKLRAVKWGNGGATGPAVGNWRYPIESYSIECKTCGHGLTNIEFEKPKHTCPGCAQGARAEESPKYC